MTGPLFCWSSLFLPGAGHCRASCLHANTRSPKHATRTTPYFLAVSGAQPGSWRPCEQAGRGTRARRFMRPRRPLSLRSQQRRYWTGRGPPARGWDTVSHALQPVDVAADGSRHARPRLSREPALGRPDDAPADNAGRVRSTLESPGAFPSAPVAPGSGGSGRGAAPGGGTAARLHRLPPPRPTACSTRLRPLQPPHPPTRERHYVAFCLAGGSGCRGCS